MILSIISYCLLATPVAFQVLPDISFGDRFDVSGMLEAQNEYYDRLARGAAGRRRSNPKLNREEAYRQHSKQLGKENLAEWYLSHLLRRNAKRAKTPTIVEQDFEKSNYIRNFARFLKKIRRSQDDMVIPQQQNSKYIKNLAKFLKQVRRSGYEGVIHPEQFSFHETEKVEHGGKDASYENNLNLLRNRENADEYRRRLQKYVNKLHGIHQNDLGISFRRASGLQPEAEVLLHHAFPFKLKIAGYIKGPKTTVKKI